MQFQPGTILIQTKDVHVYFNRLDMRDNERMLTHKGDLWTVMNTTEYAVPNGTTYKLLHQSSRTCLVDDLYAISFLKADGV